MDPASPQKKSWIERAGGGGGGVGGRMRKGLSHSISGSLH